MTVQEASTAEVLGRDATGLLPAQSLLDGLSRYHETVFIADQRGRVLWSSGAMNGSDLFIDCERGTVSKSPPRPPVARRRAEVRYRAEDPCVDIGVLSHVCAGRESLLVAVAREERHASLDETTRATLSAVLATAPDAVLAVDSRGRISFANPAAEEVLGWASERIVGVPVATLIADTKDLECVFGCLQGHETLRDRNLLFRSPGGGHRNVSASSCTMGSDLDAEPHTLFYLRDVGERMRNEAELVRTNEELEHCVNALAHDLRSPLVALLGFSRLLRQDYDEQLDETGRHFLDRIEQAGQTMEALVHDILELSRIGQPTEPLTLVDPRPVLVQLQAELKPTLDAAGIELVLPSSPPLISCDRTRLYQVFSNLIGNAIEHGGPSDEAKIWIEIRDMGTFHQIAVRDHGRGIPPESHERIFEVFESLSRKQGKGRGAGIGLAIVKKIAETHGGRIWVESHPGKGSTFHVTFPKAR